MSNAILLYCQQNTTASLSLMRMRYYWTTYSDNDNAMILLRQSKKDYALMHNYTIITRKSDS